MPCCAAQCFVGGVRCGKAIDGAACLALLRALKRAGNWRAAEAALLCVLPLPALLEHSDPNGLAIRDDVHAGGNSSVLCALRDLRQERRAAVHGLTKGVRWQSRGSCKQGGQSEGIYIKFEKECTVIITTPWTTTQRHPHAAATM